MAQQPQLTKDRNQAHSDLDEYGYCLIEEALTPKEVETAHTRLVDQAAAEDQLGLSFRDGGLEQKVIDDFGKIRPDAFSAANGGVNQRLWMLANKGRCFRDMVVHPLVDDLIGYILGSAFILSTLSGNIVKPGGMRMGLHTDQWWMPQPIRPGQSTVKASEISRAAVTAFVEPDTSLGISPAVVANTMWMLSDFSATNGSTEVVPGSHLSGAHPRGGNQSGYNVVQPEAPAGTLMVFDGRLWHGTGANTGSDERLGVLATFCAPQFRQQENQTIGLDRALWPELSDKLRARLGFSPWNAYGRVESPAEPVVEPEPERIGELHP